MAGRELVIVPGNHDHHLIEPWLERRALAGDDDLGLEQSGPPEGLAFEALAEQAGAAEVRFAYPGLWVRDDVYALHGHYLDRHLTVPTIERLGVGRDRAGARDHAHRPRPAGHRPRPGGSTWSRVRARADPGVRAALRARPGDRRRPPRRRRPVDAAVADDGRRRVAHRALRGWLLGSVAVPGAVGVANRLGLGPVRSDLSAGAIGRAGFDALGDVIENLGIRAGT